MAATADRVHVHLFPESTSVVLIIAPGEQPPEEGSIGREKFRTCDDDGRRRPGRTTSVTRTALSRSRAAPYGPHRAGLATVTGRRRLSSAVTMLSDHHLQPQSA
uniref:G-patch domain-containing protein n=1 Tax=Panagrellus redivivus TaxID=6233 RepID=A0A7E4V3Z6_PANRE